jgi:hypothetical protein
MPGKDAAVGTNDSGSGSAAGADVVGQPVRHPRRRRRRDGPEGRAEHPPTPRDDRIGGRPDIRGGGAEVRGERAGEVPGDELAAVEAVPRREPVEPERVRLALPVRVERERQLGARSGPHRGTYAGRHPTQEQRRGLDAHRERPREVLLLDGHLERHGLVVRRGRSPGERDPVEGREPGRDAGVDRRRGILGLQLAQLPLPGQEPQPVAHLGAQAAGEVERPRPRLQPVVGRDRRDPEDLLEHVGRGDRVEELLHGCTALVTALR